MWWFVRDEAAAGTLVTIPLVDPNLVRPMGIIHRRGRPLGAAARRFIQLLQSKVGDLGTGPIDEGSNGRPTSADTPSANGDGNSNGGDGHA